MSNSPLPAHVLDRLEAALSLAQSVFIAHERAIETGSVGGIDTHIPTETWAAIVEAALAYARATKVPLGGGE